MLAGESMRELVGGDDNEDGRDQQGQCGNAVESRCIPKEFVPIKHRHRRRAANQAGGEKQKLGSEAELNPGEQTIQETIWIEDLESEKQRAPCKASGLLWPRLVSVGLVLQQPVSI